MTYCDKSRQMLKLASSEAIKRLLKFDMKIKKEASKVTIKTAELKKAEKNMKELNDVNW